MTGNPPPVLAANVNQEAEPAVPNHSTDLPEIQMKKVTKKRRRNKMDWVLHATNFEEMNVDETMLEKEKPKNMNPRLRRSMHEIVEARKAKRRRKMAKTPSGF